MILRKGSADARAFAFDLPDPGHLLAGRVELKLNATTDGIVYEFSRSDRSWKPKSSSGLDSNRQGTFLFSPFPSFPRTAAWVSKVQPSPIFIVGLIATPPVGC
jgi:hypothetical protein